jgi:tetratricopeptide (TPR) repeat protein
MLNRRRIEEAMALHRDGRLAEAAQKYDALLALNPGDANLMNLQGILAGQMGDYTKSILLLQRAIDASPHLPHFHNSLAVTLERTGNRDGAANAFNNEGNLLLSQYRAADALVAFGHALRLRPQSPQYQCNYGVALIKLGRAQEAADCLAAIDAPDLSYIPLNLGNALAGIPRPIDAIAAYDRALRIDPSLVEAHWARGQAFLMLGDYAEGLGEYEWRKRWHGFENPYRTIPEWAGAPLNGNLLVVSEQGLGDTIQFARYVPMLAAEGYRIIFEVRDPLFTLFSEGFHHDGVEIVARSEMESRIGECAAHIMLMSLPHYFTTRRDTIPGDAPYLTVSDERIAQQVARLPDCAHKRIGIVRSGQSFHAGDYARSIAASVMQPLLSADCDFHSLQIVKFDDPQVTELGLGFTDFADTAAAIMAMDLVISVDTSVAHLAGALGKPVWILIPVAADWRWGLEGETTRWYATARLFRQAGADDWPRVIDSVRKALDAFIGTQNVEPHESPSAEPVAERGAPLARARILRGAGALEAALDAYDRVIDLDPDFAQAHFERGQLLAQMGQLKPGFADMEWRWAKGCAYTETPRLYKQPVWRGALPEDLQGKLLVIGEQGYGNMIQFARYAPLLTACGYRVVLETPQPLLRLFSESFVRPGLRIAAHPVLDSTEQRGLGRMLGISGQPDFAAFIGINSLPERFMTTTETVPAQTPYLSVRDSHVTKWAAKMKAASSNKARGKLKVGLIWHSDKRQDRSLPPALLHPLLENDAVHFYALQKGAMADWQFPYGNVTALGNELGDFYDTAAAIETLDLVISIDGAVAHLAGALHCPVWIMLKKNADWRWSVESDTSPWYPSARLFRQEAQGQWQDVVARIAGELERRIGQPPSLS